MSNDVRCFDGFNHAFLVAFIVPIIQGEDGHLDRKNAEIMLREQLPDAGKDTGIDQWWVAEDERYDGSDCDSAVFVPIGKQKKWAVKVLLNQMRKEARSSGRCR